MMENKMKLLWGLYVLFSLSMLIYSVFSTAYDMRNIETALHNVDLGQNMRVLDCEHNLRLLDTMSNNVTVGGSELYRIGRNQLDDFISDLLIDSFSIGLMLMVCLGSVCMYVRCENE